MSLAPSRAIACVKIGSPKLGCWTLLLWIPSATELPVTHRHPKAILFDLDDTILDYDSVADRSWKQVCDTVSPKLPGLGTQELFTALKEKARWFWSDPDRHLRGRRRPLFPPCCVLRCLSLPLLLHTPPLTGWSRSYSRHGGHGHQGSSVPAFAGWQVG